VNLKRFLAPDLVFILGILRVLYSWIGLFMDPSHSKTATACL